MSSRTTPCVSIAKVVNPLGTVTTIINTIDDTIDEYEIPIGHCSDQYVHENCDESLFRPVVTVFGNSSSASNKLLQQEQEKIERPTSMGSDLIVPVIEEHPKVLIKPKPRMIIEKKPDIIVSVTEIKSDEIQNSDEFLSKNKIKQSNKLKMIVTNEEKLKEKRKNDEDTEKIINKTFETSIKSKKKSQKVEKEPVKINREKGTKISRAIQDAVQETKIEPKKREKIEKIDFPPLFPEDPIEIEEDPIDTEAFSELYKTAFSIQESLSKNSDYIVKRTKIITPKTDFQPLPMEEILDFNMMIVDDENMDDSSVQPNSICEMEREQFFDTTASSKYDLDFAESIFSEPLAPLETFVDTFERLSYKDSSELMNFESPPRDDDDDNDDDLELDEMLPISKEHFTETNLVFADCTNLQEDEDDEDKQLDTETTIIGRGDNNSSDDTEDSFNDKKEQKLEEDEELQPLISTATTSSDTTPNFSKAILDSLPDNQKDSNKQQNNNKKKPRRKKR